MAQTGYTPILIYASGTATNVPLAANMTSSASGAELALNYADGKLYYKNSSGTVTLLASTAGASGDVVGPASATANGIALFNSTTGKLIKDSAASDGLIYGITVGRGAGAVSTNTAVGASALAANTSGDTNTATGFQALITNTSGASNTATGVQALRFNTSGGANAAFGRGSLANNTTGGNNVACGQEALNSNTTASNNTAVGYQAAYTNVTGAKVTAVGFSALRTSTADYNSAFGAESMYSNTTGTLNTALGRDALFDNTTGSNNVAVGQSALENNTTGSYSTAVGYQALALNTVDYSVAVGYGALGLNTTGTKNVAVGTALFNSTTGSNNIAMGWQASDANTTASNNVSIGHQALTSNTTGSNNVCIGYQAGYSFGGGDGNNTFVGYRAGYSSTSGGIGANTFVGVSSGNAMTTGYYNTILGRYGGNEDSLDIRTLNEYIVISNGAATWSARQQGSGGWFQKNNSASWSTTSDARLKTNIEEITNGLEVINALRPVDFDYIISGENDKGFIAQEYELVLPDQITHDDSGAENVKALTNGEPVKTIRRNLDPYFVSAIKTLTAQIEELKAELATLKGN
jgi:hypothetical protein